MNEHSRSEELHQEGFTHTYVWEDGPNALYSEHAHPPETAHIILEGEVTLTMVGKSQTYHAGDRCEVPARAIHSAKMGSRGCRYLIGER